MALLGRWGAGKTRLARLVMRYMTDPESFRRALKAEALPELRPTSCAIPLYGSRLGSTAGCLRPGFRVGSVSTGAAGAVTPWCSVRFPFS